jgi:elongation factor Ts
MAKFGPKDIKKLREMTDAGMMDCKEALKATDGDMEKAVEWLRKKGLGAAAKKADKVAAEGVVAIKTDGNKAIMVEINSQTDFVAKNEKFQNFVNEVMEYVISNDFDTVEDILAGEINGQPFNEYLALQIATIGENLVVRRYAKVVTDGSIGSYVHANNRVGVIVASDVAGVEDALKNIAMHAAAMNPKYLNEESVPADVIEKEREIAKEQLLKEGKPEHILEKILPGKIKRFMQDNTLENQKFVMDDKVTVKDYLKSQNKDAKLTDYVRFELGEGIEKKEEDFAAEVAKQIS